MFLSANIVQMCQIVSSKTVYEYVINCTNIPVDKKRTDSTILVAKTANPTVKSSGTVKLSTRKSTEYILPYKKTQLCY